MGAAHLIISSAGWCAAKRASCWRGVAYHPEALLVVPPCCAVLSCRSVICYFGHHYQAFVLSEELQQWLLFDDHVIKLVGDWQQVKAAMVADRLQPSLLFYENAAEAAAHMP